MMPDLGSDYNPNAKGECTRTLPVWLLYRTKAEISFGARLCYGWLVYHAGLDGRCHPKIATLAAEMAVTERAVLNYLEELRRLGLIRSERQGQNGVSRYFFLRHKWQGEWEDARLDVNKRSLRDLPDVNKRSGPDVNVCSDRPEQTFTSLHEGTKEGTKEEDIERAPPGAKRPPEEPPARATTAPRIDRISLGEAERYVYLDLRTPLAEYFEHEAYPGDLAQVCLGIRAQWKYRRFEVTQQIIDDAVRLAIRRADEGSENNDRSLPRLQSAFADVAHIAYEAWLEEAGLERTDSNLD